MDSKIYAYWERFAIYVVGLLCAVCAWIFLEQDSRIDALEIKVQALQVDKVSRQELKDLEDRIYKRMDGMKGDIIDRLDWYFGSPRSKKNRE